MTGVVNDRPSAPRARNPRGRGDALRAEILAGTRRLLDQRVQVLDLPVSLREVSREVGISAQSIYLQFDDKEALVDALCADGYERLVDILRRADDEQPAAAGLRDRLAAQAHAFVAFARSDRGVFQLMIGHPDATPDRPIALLHGFWTDLLARHVGPDLDDEPPGRRASLFLSTLLGGVLLATVTTTGTTTPDRLDELIDQLVDRIASPARRR